MCLWKHKPCMQPSILALKVKGQGHIHLMIINSRGHHDTYLVLPSYINFWSVVFQLLCKHGDKHTRTHGWTGPKTILCFSGVQDNNKKIMNFQQNEEHANIQQFWITYYSGVAQKLDSRASVLTAFFAETGKPIYLCFVFIITFNLVTFTQLT